MLFFTTCVPNVEANRLPKPAMPPPHSWGELRACPIAAPAPARTTEPGPNVRLTYWALLGRLGSARLGAVAEVAIPTITSDNAMIFTCRRIAPVRKQSA